MKHTVKRFFRSISFRLLLGLVLTIVVILSAYTWMTVVSTKDQLTDVVHACAERTSQLVNGATHYGMLTNHKETVAATIERFAQAADVAAVRIYDKAGKIAFSTDGAEIGHVVDEEHHTSCVACHAQQDPPSVVPEATRERITTDADGHRELELTVAIPNEPACVNAACHAHDADTTVLGVLDVHMSLDRVDTISSEMRSDLILTTAAIILVIGLWAWALIFRTVRRPVRRLIEGTERIAQGDLDTRVEGFRSDELGRLAHAFNKMTADLSAARDELTQWSDTLERKVVEKTEELARVQRQVLHIEKMASLGQLSATVAHELNNPLAGMLTYTKLVQRQLARQELAQPVATEIDRHLGLVQKEASRCGDIVKNLLLFARQPGAKLGPCHLDDIIDRSVMLVQHHLKISNVHAEVTKIDGDDRLVCDSGQIQQALVALLVNAVEAMKSNAEGTLTIKAEVRDDDGLRLTVADTGPGISPDDLPHIFEPFYSTKHAESGVGLGLAVVYGIIQRHGGTIDVDSTPGHGATFVIQLPRRAPHEPHPSQGDEP